MEPRKRRRFDIDSILGESAAKKIEKVVGGPAVERAPDSPNDTRLEEKLKLVDAALRGAKLSMSFSAFGRSGYDAGENVEAVFKAASRGASKSVMFGGEIREAMEKSLMELCEERGSRSPRLSSLRDSVLLRALVFMDPKIERRLESALAEQGYAWNFGEDGLDHSYESARDLMEIPEVAELASNPLFGLKGPGGLDGDRLRSLVFDALRMHPDSRKWMGEALGVLGESPLSAFVPGGLSKLGSSVMLSAIKQEPKIWNNIGPAIKECRRVSLDFGGRSLESGRSFAQRMPLGLLGSIYAADTKAHDDDCFSFYAKFDEILSDRADVDYGQFQRNVGRVLLGVSTGAWKPDCPEKIVEALFSKDVDAVVPVDLIEADGMLKSCQSIVRKAALSEGPEQEARVAGFLMSRKDPARAFGRLVSEGPLSHELFEPGSSYCIAPALGEVGSSWFDGSKGEISAAPIEEIGLAPAVRKNMNQMARVVSVFRESGLSAPYSLLEKVYSAGRMVGSDDLPKGAHDLLMAVPADGVPARSGIAACFDSVRAFLEAEKGQEAGFEILDVAKSAARSWICSDSVEVADSVKERLATDALNAKSFGDMLNLWNKPEFRLQAERKKYASHMERNGVWPAGAGLESYSCDRSQSDALASVIVRPVGMGYLDRRKDPSPKAVIEAVSWYDQRMEAPSSFWEYHFDRLSERVSREGSVLVFERGEGPGASGAVEISEPDIEEGASHCLCKVLGVDEVEFLPELDARVIESETATRANSAWLDPKGWERAERGLLGLQSEVARVLGPDSELDDVPSFFKLSASCFPDDSEVYLAGEELSRGVFEQVGPSGVGRNVAEKLGKLLPKARERAEGRGLGEIASQERVSQDRSSI